MLISPFIVIIIIGWIIRCCLCSSIWNETETEMKRWMEEKKSSEAKQTIVFNVCWLSLLISLYVCVCVHTFSPCFGLAAHRATMERGKTLIPFCSYQILRSVFFFLLLLKHCMFIVQMVCRHFYRRTHLLFHQFQNITDVVTRANKTTNTCSDTFEPPIVFNAKPFGFGQGFVTLFNNNKK